MLYQMNNAWIINFSIKSVSREGLNNDQQFLCTPQPTDLGQQRLSPHPVRGICAEFRWVLVDQSDGVAGCAADRRMRAGGGHLAPPQGARHQRRGDYVGELLFFDFDGRWRYIEIFN